MRRALDSQKRRHAARAVPGYAASGLYLFRDYVRCLEYISPWLLSRLGVPPPSYCNLTQGQEVDSSAVVLDKRVPMAWRALQLTAALNAPGVWPAATKLFAPGAGPAARTIRTSHGASLCEGRVAMLTLPRGRADALPLRR